MRALQYYLAPSIMSGITGLMKYTNRLAPRLARFIVRQVADREIIACGLRDRHTNQPIIIFSPHFYTDCKILTDNGTSRPIIDLEDFVGSLVMKHDCTEAEQGEIYRVSGRSLATQKTVCSPKIYIKDRTIYRDDGLKIDQQDDSLTVSWPEAPPAMVYFLAFTGAGDQAVFGRYLKEERYVYPLEREVVLAIGDPTCRLMPGQSYTAHLLSVDYHGWVPEVRQTTFRLDPS